MIRKVKKKDYGKYDVKGFRLGQDVLLKEHGNTIYTIVGLGLWQLAVLQMEMGYILEADQLAAAALLRKVLLVEME